MFRVAERKVKVPHKHVLHHYSAIPNFTRFLLKSNNKKLNLLRTMDILHFLDKIMVTDVK